MTSAIVVSYRTGSMLRGCLDALRAQAELEQIVVVDNGNPADDAAWLDSLAAADAMVQVVRPGRNLGFAAGCNLGAAQAKGEYLAFVNPDLIVPPGSFAGIQSVFQHHPGVWLCGGRLLNMDGSEQRGGRRELLTPWRCLVEALRLDRLAPNHPYFRRLHLIGQEPLAEVMAVPTVSGAFMVMPRARYQELGGMDEAMFLHMEDVDLCLRILLAGGTIAYCAEVPVHHGLSTSDVPRAFVEWHKTRSTIYYFHKHFRATYPGWSLIGLGVLLWARFAVLVLRHLPTDIGRMLRHSTRRA